MTNTATESPTPPLFQSERQHEIATATLQAGRVEVSELALRYNVTTETIRRDERALLSCVFADDVMQRPVEKVSRGVMTFDATSAIF